MVIDPAREQAVLRWPRSANAAQLVKLLDDGERAVRGGGSDALAELARADRLAADKKPAAAAAYRALLPSLPADKRPRAVESLLNALALGHDTAACAKAAAELVPSLPRGPSFANAASIGLGCALELKGDERTGALKVLAPLGDEAVTLPGLLADDRSGIYEQLVEVRDQSGDLAGKKAMARRWLAFLEGEAAAARSPEQRAAFDPHRVAAALALGEPLRAEAALKASERDLPADYNPPARLALVYGEAKRYDDALVAIDRALGKVYGPRALRLFDQKADYQAKKGDTAGAKATLQKALATANALPPGFAGRTQRIAQLRHKLEALR
jgi:tetratricopeptide (TPR) repeat protein